MKRTYIIMLMIISIWISPFCFYSQNFVTLHNNDFMLNGSRFFVKAVNYHVDIVFNPNLSGVFVAPHANGKDAGNGTEYKFHTAAQCSTQIMNDFIWLISQGFNSVRIVEGLEFDKTQLLNGSPAFPLDNVTNWANPTPIVNQYPYTEVFNCIQTILDAAAAAELATGKPFKVQLLAGGGDRLQDPSFSATYYVPYLQALASRFANSTVLYSYDFINEPTVQNPSGTRYMPPKKGDACSLVQTWNNAIQSRTSRQMTTVGLIPDAIGVWDPGFLPLDFLSYHIYANYNSSEPNYKQTGTDRVKSLIRWCSVESPLPWIIGETSFAWSSVTTNTVPDNGTDVEQQMYARETLNAVRDCGGAGYSWWKFRDHNNWEANYGLLDENYNPTKPLLLSEFLNFNPTPQPNSCTIPGNYFNLHAMSNIPVHGTVRDQNNQPIANAMIAGWDSNWGNYTFTYSDTNGDFNLPFSGTLHRVHVTGVRSNVVKFDPLSGSYINGIPLFVGLNTYTQTQNINISNVTVSAPGTDYSAANSITVYNSNITSAGSSTLQAGNEIYITESSASLGSNFYASSGPVYADCSTVLSSHSRPGAQADSTSDNPPVQDLSYKSDSKITRALEGVKVYPNPSNETINIEYDANQFENTRIEIYDGIGRLVLKDEGKTAANVTSIEPGLYLLKFRSGGYEKTFKITIQH